MHRYVILTNRKRAIVALVHSVAFLLIALYGTISVVRPLGASSPASAWTVVGVYVAVSSALGALAAMAGNGRERLYFAFCAASATFGLLRQILGDPPMHFAVYVRVAMLSCAVAMGLGIVRAHGGKALSTHKKNRPRTCLDRVRGCGPKQHWLVGRLTLLLQLIGEDHGVGQIAHGTPQTAAFVA